MEKKKCVQYCKVERHKNSMKDLLRHDKSSRFHVFFRQSLEYAMNESILSK